MFGKLRRLFGSKEREKEREVDEVEEWRELETKVTTYTLKVTRSSGEEQVMTCEGYEAGEGWLSVKYLEDAKVSKWPILHLETEIEEMRYINRDDIKDFDEIESEERTVKKEVKVRERTINKTRGRERTIETVIEVEDGFEIEEIKEDEE